MKPTNLKHNVQSSLLIYQPSLDTVQGIKANAMRIIAKQASHLSSYRSVWSEIQAKDK